MLRADPIRGRRSPDGRRSRAESAGCSCTIYGPHMGQRRPGWVDPLPSLERPDDDPIRHHRLTPFDARCRWCRCRCPVSAHRRPGRRRTGRALRSPVRARRLRRGPGGRPAGPAHPHPGPPGPRPPSSTWPTGGHRQRGGQRGRRRHPHPGTPRLLRRGGRLRPARPGPLRHRHRLLVPRPGEAGDGPVGHRRSWPARRASTSSGGVTMPDRRRAPSGRSPRRPCRRCTSCSWPRRRAPR